MEFFTEGRHYEEIEEEAEDLVEALDLFLFPLNSFEVAKKLNIKLIKYSEIANEEDRKYIESKMADGCSTLNKNGYVIFYNEHQKPDQIDFTIWHEIAHIQLGHIDSECVMPYRMQEYEANHYATYIIALISTLQIFRNSNTYNDINPKWTRYVFEYIKNAVLYGRLKDVLRNETFYRMLKYVPKEDIA